MMKRQTKTNEYEVPLKLKVFVQTLLQDGVWGNKDEAERVSGVRKGLFYDHFKKHEEFREYYADECHRYIRSKEHIANFALMKNIAKGKEGSLKMFYEMINRLKSGNQTNVKVENKVSPTMIVEFVDERVGEDGVEEVEDIFTEESKDGHRIKGEI